MNAYRYRLIRHRVSGLLVPVAECLGRSHGGLRRAARAAAAAVLFGCGGVGTAATPEGLVPHEALAWLGASIDAGRSDSSTLTIQQTQARALLNWRQFDLRAGDEVVFDQKGNANWVALNRIFDLVPSQIAGRIRADGDVYLINQNGIVFKGTAQVNTGSFIASALEIRDEAFTKGLLSLSIGTAAFTWGGTEQQYQASVVEVDPGARIASSTGGRVMLLAPRVVNQGSITTPEGQTILAAGSRVYLTAPLDSTLRGFLVEVDPLYPAGGGAPVGGQVTNAPLGRVLAERGNATLAAFAVNQQGQVRATTSVRLNGSVYLQARDSAGNAAGEVATVPVGTVNIPRGTRGGALVLGPGSTTAVLPEPADRQTTQDAQGFTPSRIDLTGKTIVLQPDSLVSAPGGIVVASAQQGQQFGLGPAGAGTRIYLDRGARIDVAGTAGETVPVERNFIRVELRGNELRDAPVQRASFLRGETVVVDVRRGTPLADVSGYTAQIGRTVGERTATGGSVTLRSEGDVILREGSLVDVSGGSIRYTDGLAAETRLMGADGRVYGLSEARPDRVYTGFADRYVVGSQKWGTQVLFQTGRDRNLQPGYVEGRSAGSITLNARSLVLDGELRGVALPGGEQRSLASRPTGGTLVLGEAASGGGPLDFRLGAVELRGTVDRLASGFAASDALDPGRAGLVQIDSRALGRGGFSRLSVYSNDRVAVAEDGAVILQPGGSLAVTARRISVAGDVRVAGGLISLTTREVAGGSVDPAEHTVSIAPGVRLDAAGLWTNDSPVVTPRLGTDPLVPNGGRISLSSAADLRLGTGAVLDVSAGAVLARSGTTTPGSAGSISLSTGRIGLGDSDAQQSVLELGAQLRGYAVRGGGSLSISTSAIRIGGVSASGPRELLLGTDFIGRGGFAQVSLDGVDGLVVAPNASLAPVLGNVEILPGARVSPTGTSLGELVRVVELPAHQRMGFALTMASSGTSFGNVRVDNGAAVDVGAGGTLSLSSGRRITVDGTLSAPGGSISLSNPPPGSQSVFEGDVSIWLGESSRLLARGVFMQVPDARGLVLGNVLPGGSVTISAGRGYLVAEQGSLVDVSGALAGVDVRSMIGTTAGFLRREVASAAGAISLSAREAILYDGAFAARGGAPSAEGGRLSVAIDALPQAFFPQGARRVVVSAGGFFVPAGLDPGEAVETNPFAPNAPLNGRAFLAVDRVAAAGFDSVSLRASGAIEFHGDVAMALRRNLSMDAPSLVGYGGMVSLSAAAVSLGNAAATRQTAPAPVPGGGTLEVSGRLVDVVGQSSVSGFSRVRLRSAGDLRLRGVVFDTDPQPNSQSYVLAGALETAGDLFMEAAQVYPTTLSRFRLSATGAEATVSISRGAQGGVAGPLLSAGGRLTVSAAKIVQGGVLAAPFGEIVLDAGNRIEVLPGSITSVSGASREIPLGTTELSGRDFVYPLGSGYGNLVLKAPPEKRIVLAAKDVDAAGTVDLSGGGDLFAYEFVPGPGGSRDVLQGDSAAPAFAILPGVRSGFGPFDHHYSQGFTDLEPGRQVALSGVDGLQDGVYTLLPARYALLPGAYLVKPRAGTTDFLSADAVRLADGAQVVEGFHASIAADGSSLRAARSEAFEVASSAVVRNRAEYSTTLASRFFSGAAGAQLPGDAGRLSISVTENLRLAGVFLSDFVPGRRGAEVDLVAPRLAVVAGGATAPAGFVGVDAGQLNRLGAASLLLGGTRSSTSAGTALLAGGGSPGSVVRVDLGAGTALEAPELMLAATGEVVVGAQSRLGTRSGPGVSDSPLLLQGDGALLRAATGPGRAVVRDAVQRVAGTITVEAGASVTGQGSLLLDATLDTRVLSGTTLAAPEVALSAGQVSVGEAPPGTTGLVLTEQLLAGIAAARSLSLRSYGDFGLFGAARLGGMTDAGVPLLDSLVMEAARIVGHGTEVKQASAGTLVLRGLGASQADALRGTATLSLLAGTAARPGRVAFEAGDLALHGFESVLVGGAQEIVFSGAGLIRTGADVTLDAGRITAAPRADHGIVTTGRMQTLASAAEPSQTVAPSAALLRLTASEVFHQGRIAVPSGEVALEATASGGNGVRLAAGSRIDASGRVTRFADGVERGTAGGTVRVRSAGDIQIAAGASVDVSAGRAGTDAGLLDLRAAGAVGTGGTLLARSFAPGDRGGRLQVDAGSLPDFAALAAAAGAGGFTGAQSFRVRTGDLEVGTGVNIKASEVSIAVDNGALSLLGDIDASGANGGRVELWSRLNLSMGGQSAISAAATTAAGRGGRVVAGTAAGSLSFAPGALIDVNGAADQGGREVLLRAPRAGADVAIAQFSATVQGAASVVAEGVRTYTFSSIGTTQFTTIDADNTSFMAGASAITARLPGLTAVRPGVEIHSTGNLTLSADWNLAMRRPGGEPGVLTLRAGGDLLLNGSLNDGFAQVQPATGAIPVNSAIPLAGPSWSYRLVAGADADAANPLVTRDAALLSSGDVVLGAGRVIRTGTGSIDVAAGRDLRLESARSAFYTAGQPGPAVPGFVAPSLSGVPAPAYNQGGGDVRLRAGRDAIGTASDQLVTEWLYREVRRTPGSTPAFENRQASWWVRFDTFQQGVGALGGGNVVIDARRDVVNLGAVVPTNGRIGGNLDEVQGPSAVREQGGGDLVVRAGRHVRGGVYHVQSGSGLVEAGGDIGAGRQLLGTDLNTLVAMGNAQVTLRAGGDVTLESAFNPTATRQVTGNVGITARTSHFFTYAPESAVRVESVAGNARLANNSDLLRELPNSPLAARPEEAATSVIYPGSAFVLSHRGDVVVERRFTLFPSATGQLELLAAGSVDVRGSISMSDVAPGSLAVPWKPDLLFSERIQPLLVNAAEQGPLFHDESTLHAADSQPVLIAARDGDIRGPADATGVSPFSILPKAARFTAGRDIRDTWVIGQNVRATDVTLFRAGRDIAFTTLRTALGEQRSNGGGIVLGGPGDLVLEAGRNVDLGNSAGLVTRGNLNNPFLPESGAAIRVATGAGRAGDGAFIARYLEGQDADAVAYRAELLSYMRGRGASGVADEAGAVAAFKALDSSQRVEFVNRVLFDQIKRAGRDFSAGLDESYARGYGALLALYPVVDENGVALPAQRIIDLVGPALASLRASRSALGPLPAVVDVARAAETLFSGGRTTLEALRDLWFARYSGDVNLFFSQVKTEQGGDIELRVPGGLVNAGLANPGAIGKSASDLGIVTVRGGTVRGSVLTDFQVNQSRVFTLQGGDILLWASLGNIDAGRGAKTATATPPPQVVFRGDRFVLDTSRSVEGSGIGVLLSRDGIEPGDVDLLAPAGIVDAGDAGIRSAGILNVAALAFNNSANAQAAGGTLGIATTTTSSLGGLSGTSAGVTDAARSVQQATERISERSAPVERARQPSFLSLEVLGLGDDNERRR
ncbi:MAG: filamentous hemagglutinin family protein [Rhodocyclaceae bacterium]|nr:filamentous hemagglutinin family protein [Rhodocyclaceae bacterium]MCA3145632.1 filamentous hemagglutinin family protein [Rhodocyclaceae bacterium]